MGGLWSYGLSSHAETFIYEGPLEAGTILARVSEKYMDVDFGFFVDVAFGSSSPAAGEAVFGTLIGFRELLRGTIEEFTSRFF
ncbi:MAG TPA: hypothetical protein VMR52_03915 [Dehalococcoidia bacterium]|nr:hypothetical protein [Dehalococcoidia bacterium]